MEPVKRNIHKGSSRMYGLKLIAMAACIGFAFVGPQPAIAAEPIFEIRIDSQPLERAANQLAGLIAKQVVLYSEDSEGIQVPALIGTFTEQAALFASISPNVVGCGVVNLRATSPVGRAWTCARWDTDAHRH